MSTGFLVISAPADVPVSELNSIKRDGSMKGYDIKFASEIRKNISIPLNLEIAPTVEMLKIALKNKPKLSNKFLKKGK